MRSVQDVVLVSMPFGPEMSPSLGLSLLKAGLTARGRSARVLYFTLRFAERIGVGLYSTIATDGSRSVRELLGEWTFRRALFGSTREEDERYVTEVLRQRSVWEHPSLARPVPASLVARVFRARERVEAFLSDCRDVVLAERPRVVGFTSVFQQHVASLALARRIKEAAPETFVVFGGANCEGPMGAETVRQFPFVDAAVSGEGDLVFPDLAERLLSSRPVDGLPGVRTRATLAADAASRFPNAPSVPRMDDLPEPDSSDYFEQFERSRLSKEWTPGLFFETSRGCWWGEKSACTFCGLNGTTMRYRSRSPARALAELSSLSENHPGCDIQVVDNILDTRYFDTFLPDLAAKKPGLALFYETKSNLTREQVASLAGAGVTRIQPGIESLSDPILRLMKKGVTALQNVQLLKWCRELGVKPYWNFLWGFPGEPPEEYARMAGLVPLLSHLTPPEGVSGLRLDRFSPGFEEPSRFGFTSVAPLASYAHVYPLPDEALFRLAYYFGFRPADGRDAAGYVAPLLAAVRRWRRAAGRSALVGVDVGGALAVWDLRPSARRRVRVLRGRERAAVLACATATDVSRLSGSIRAETGHPVTPEEAETCVAPLVAAGLLLRDGSRLLSLVLPPGEKALAGEALERFWRLASSLGRRERRGLVVPLRDVRRGAAGRLLSRRGPAATRQRRIPEPLVASRFSLSRNQELVIS